MTLKSTRRRIKQWRPSDSASQEEPPLPTFSPRHNNGPSLEEEVVIPQQWIPHKLQLRAVKWLLEHAEAGVFADPGVGKTSIALSAFKLLKRKKLVRKALIVVPQRPLRLVWPKEILKWLDFNELRLELMHGPKKDGALHRPADLYACTPEGLWWLTGAVKRTSENGRSEVVIDAKKFQALGFDMLIVDELTKFKNSQSDRAKVLRAVAHTFGRRWGLTGDPAPNGLADLFGQMLILDLGKSLGRYITHFRREFMVPDPYGFGWSMKEDVEEKIYQRIAPVVHRIDDSHLDIPEEFPVDIKVELPPKARRAYDEMEKELLALVDNEEIVANNAASAASKCHQIAAGGLYKGPHLPDVEAAYLAAQGKGPPLRVKHTGPRPWSPLHDEKTDAVEDLLEQLQGEPLFCAYWYHHDLERLTKRLARTYGHKGELPCIGGSTSEKEAERWETLWNRGQLPLLMVQPASAAWGLNMQGRQDRGLKRAARHVCWHTMTWDYEQYNQTIRRVRRQGNKVKRVFVHHIIAAKTVDEVQRRVVPIHKRGVQQRLFDALKAMAKGRRN